MGLNVKLDVGLYRLDQQVACQRYRQPLLDAISRVRDFVANAFAPLRNLTPVAISIG